MNEVSNVVMMPISDEVRVRETGVLLMKPKWTSNSADHRIVYALRGGRVGSAALEVYKVPEAARDSVLVLPGIVPVGALEMLPIAAALVDRIAPWVEVHLVPSVSTRNTRAGHSEAAGWGYIVGDRRYGGAGGICFAQAGFLMIQMSSGPSTLSMLCHELLHATWWRLSDAAREVLSKAVAQGTPWVTEYDADTEERVARLFERWSSARLEGLPEVAGADIWSVEGIFQFVWSGELADHQIVRSLVHGYEALMDRRGLQPLPPPELEVVEVEQEETEDATDSMIALIGELAATTARAVLRGAKWAWHGSASTA